MSGAPMALDPPPIPPDPDPVTQAAAEGIARFVDDCEPDDGTYDLASAALAGIRAAGYIAVPHVPTKDPAQVAYATHTPDGGYVVECRPCNWRLPDRPSSRDEALDVARQHNLKRHPERTA